LKTTCTVSDEQDVRVTRVQLIHSLHGEIASAPTSWWKSSRSLVRRFLRNLKACAVDLAAAVDAVAAEDVVEAEDAVAAVEAVATAEVAVVAEDTWAAVEAVATAEAEDDTKPHSEYAFHHQFTRYK
jgi:urease accessory protein UreE